MARIPSTYQEVEWIGSNGTATITTDLSPSANTKFKINMLYERYGGGLFVGNSMLNDQFRMFAYSGNWYLDIYNESGSNRIYGGSVSTSTWYNLEVGNHYIKNLDTGTDIITGTVVNSWTSTGQKMGLWSSTDYGKIKYWEVYEENILVGNFIPCYRKSDNVIGLYDLVSSTFYTNTSGTLSKGADIFYYKYLIRDGQTLYKTTDGTDLVELTGATLNKALFQSDGYDSIIPGDLLLSNTLSTPEILCWNSDNTRSMVADVTAMPNTQTIVATVNATSSTITGVESVDVSCEGSPTFSISRDNGTTWEEYDGTQWVTEVSGMQPGIVEDADWSWAAGTSFLFKTIIRPTDATTKVTKVTFKFTNN